MTKREAVAQLSIEQLQLVANAAEAGMQKVGPKPSDPKIRKAIKVLRQLSTQKAAK